MSAPTRIRAVRGTVKTHDFIESGVMSTAQKVKVASGKDSSPTSFVGEAKDFIQGSVGELKKISTPTRQEAMQATVVTLFIIAFMSVALFLLDLFFHALLSVLIV